MICDALAKAKDLLSKGEADALMEEEVVRRGQESRGQMEVRPEGPEGLDQGKGSPRHRTGGVSIGRQIKKGRSGMARENVGRFREK